MSSVGLPSRIRSLRKALRPLNHEPLLIVADLDQMLYFCHAHLLLCRASSRCRQAVAFGIQEAEHICGDLIGGGARLLQLSPAAVSGSISAYSFGQLGDGKAFPIDAIALAENITDTLSKECIVLPAVVPGVQIGVGKLLSNAPNTSSMDCPSQNKDSFFLGTVEALPAHPAVSSPEVYLQERSTSWH